MRFITAFIIVTVAAPIAAQSTNMKLVGRTKSKPVVAKSPPVVVKAVSATTSSAPIIEIGMKDWTPQKEKVLADAKTLADAAETMRDTPQYVRQYIAYSKAVGALGASNWSDDEKALLIKVPQPSEGALKLYISDKEAAEQRVKDKIDAIDKERERLANQRLMEEQLAEQQRKAKADEQFKQRTVAAQERQADAAESQVEATRAQTAATQSQANAQSQFNQLLRYGY